jgi:hypothetical protein
MREIAAAGFASLAMRGFCNFGLRIAENSKSDHGGQDPRKNKQIQPAIFC